MLNRPYIHFFDDFLGVNFRPEWEIENDITLTGVSGTALLVASNPAKPARLRLGTAASTGHLPDINNWLPALNPVLEVRAFMNTLDATATIGFVGTHDGYSPQDDFVALWRPDGWQIQGSNDNTITTILTSFIHTPGVWFHFKFELTPTLATFYPDPDSLPAFIEPPYVTQAPLLIEFQLWATDTNHNANMWIDYVSVVQNRQ